MAIGQISTLISLKGCVATKDFLKTSRLTNEFRRNERQAFFSTFDPLAGVVHSLGRRPDPPENTGSDGSRLSHRGGFGVGRRGTRSPAGAIHRNASAGQRAGARAARRAGGR